MNNKLREERIALFNETVDTAERGSYLINGNEVVINELDDYMTNKTVFYKKKVDMDHSTLPRFETVIKVMNNDSLYEGKNLLDDGLKVAVLNMASYVMPGGGVRKGSHAQEEEIFLRTNLYKSLYAFHDIAGEYNVERNPKYSYPLDFRYGGIYTPKVTVFRGGQDTNYSFLEEPYTLDIISVSAVRNKEGMETSKKTNDITRTKVKQMLDIALENGNDALVLGAFGCGAYHNDPTTVSKIFADVLVSEEYSNLFKKIHFAILDGPKTNNYNIFKTIFG